MSLSSSSLDVYLVCSRPGHTDWMCDVQGTVSIVGEFGIGRKESFVACFNNAKMQKKQYTNIFHRPISEIPNTLRFGDVIELEIFIQIIDAGPPLNIDRPLLLRDGFKTTRIKEPPVKTFDIGVNSAQKFSLSVGKDNKSVTITYHHHRFESNSTLWAVHAKYCLKISPADDKILESWFTSSCSSATHDLDKDLFNSDKTRGITLIVLSEEYFPVHIGDPELFVPRKEVPTSKFAEMFDKSSTSDVLFKMGPNHEIFHSHRFVLSTMSPYFEDMMVKKAQNASIKKPFVIIVDKDPQVFKSLLRFLYLGQLVLPDNRDFLKNLLKIANGFDYYDIIIASCALICPENVLLFMPYLSVLPNSLVDHVWRTIDSYPEDILSSEYFIDNLSQSEISDIIKRDTFYTEELRIFHAVLSWAEKKCMKYKLDFTNDHRRLFLCPKDLHKGPNILRHVRFNLMSKKEFTEDESIKGILTSNEKSSVLRIMNRDNLKEPIGLSRFDHRPRIPLINGNI